MARPLSVNVILCEHVLIEKSNLISAIRTLSVLTVPSRFAHFYVLTSVLSDPFAPVDLDKHVIKIQMINHFHEVIAETTGLEFRYSKLIDLRGPGGFTLTTEMNIDMEPLPNAGTYLVCVFIDDQIEARAAVMLKRN